MASDHELIERIWRVPVYLPYLQPDLTKQAVLDAEASLGVKLPDSYLALLEGQNGGYIRYSLAPYAHEMIAGTGPHFPSLLHTDLEEIQEWVSYDLRGLVPFDGDGHWHLCLDYRVAKQGEPKITYIDVECDDQRPVADSFDAYLQMLVPDLPADDLYFVHADPIQPIVEQLSKRFYCETQAPDTWAHGYPVYRFGKEGNWCWLSPNNVKRGFVHTDDPRYEELCGQLPGTAKRFPELPAEAWIASATESLKRPLKMALDELGCLPAGIETKGP